MAYDPVLRLAVKRPTYESDFSAIAQMLNESKPVVSGDYSLFRWGDTYLLMSGEGVHCHLLKEYAIHHLLYYQYKRAG